MERVHKKGKPARRRLAAAHAVALRLRYSYAALVFRIQSMVKRMPRKYWVSAALFGLAAGVAVASVVSFLDWQANPSGIFHDDSGTNWRFVRETWFSWFAPVAPAVFAASVPVLYWLAKRT
jgi:hypothetical protein